MNKFTKAPWRFTEHYGNIVIHNDAGEEIARVQLDYYVIPWTKPHNQRDDARNEHSLAGAHLIAAAPDMYEELSALKEWLEDELDEWLPVNTLYYPNGTLIRMKENYEHIVAAIEKAEGKWLQNTKGRNE